MEMSTEVVPEGKDEPESEEERLERALAVVKGELGSLTRVKQVVRVGVFVCSEAGFTDQPKVANGASELLVEVFGERGKHARAAVGNVALPLGAAVEVEFLFEVE